MKLTKQQLKQLIKEELRKLMEDTPPFNKEPERSDMPCVGRDNAKDPGWERSSFSKSEVCKHDKKCRAWCAKPENKDHSDCKKKIDPKVLCHCRKQNCPSKK